MFSADAPASGYQSEVHTALVDALARDLQDADYTNEAIENLLGHTQSEALAADDPVPAHVALHNLDTDSALAWLVRLFLLAERVPQSALDAALPNVGSKGLAELNLVELSGTEAVAKFDLRPYSVDEKNYWMSSDLGSMQVSGSLRPDHVLGVGQASLTLAHATVRSRAESALDLGTGCGIQAIHLLEHVENITVTDISARALAFARFNFLLNRQALGLDETLSRIRFKLGSLLEPVKDEKFDIIVSNPPFVITPRTERTEDEGRYEYRDGGQEGDAIVAELMAHLPEHLNPGGYAQMLANWEIKQGQTLWYGRLQSWLPPDVSVWVVQREQQSAPEYARMWLRDAAESDDLKTYRRAFAEYQEDFAARNVDKVGFGLVYLHQPLPDKTPWQYWEEHAASVNPPLGIAIGRTVERLNELGAYGNALEFSEETLRRVGALRLQAASDVTYEQHRRLGAEDPEIILLRQGGGFAKVQPLSSAAAGVVGASDGSFTIAELAAGYRSLLPEEEQPDFEIDHLLAEIGRLYVAGFMTAAVT